MTETEVLYCANHPDRETLLRCNKCGKPICMKCAQLTDVGYRCKDCIRSQQNVYFNAQSWDNPLALVVSFVVTVIATPILAALLAIAGFFGWLLAFIAGPSAGGILTQIIRWAVGKRRGRYLSYFAIAGIIQETDTTSSAGIPFFNKLPVVGGAFGNRSYSKERTELIVFMTPRVIYDTNEMTEASDELKGKLKKLQRLIKE